MPKPYLWLQTEDQITITFAVPLATRSREIDVHITNEGIKAGLKNHAPVIEGSFYQEVNKGDSIWQLESGVVTIHIEKSDEIRWPFLIGLQSKIDPHSQYEYGRFMEEGFGGQPDTEEAFQLYQEAAQRGSEFAQMKMIGILLGRDPNFKNVNDDPEEALEYLHMAADQHENPLALFELGMLYQSDEIVPKDYAKAEGYLIKASMMGNYQALYTLGLMYRRGDESTGVEPQPEKAILMWRRAAEMGSPEACYALGMAFYVDSETVKTDLYMSLAFFEKAQELDKKFSPPDALLKTIAALEEKAREEKEREDKRREGINQKLSIKEEGTGYGISTLASVGLAVGAVFLFHLYMTKH